MNVKLVCFGCVAIIAVSLGIYGFTSRQSKDSETAGMNEQQRKSRDVDSPAVNTWTDETKIGQIVAERPQTARIFDLVGIDYCCGGSTTLGEAADQQKVDRGRLLAALLTVGMPTQETEHRNWQQADMGELIDHIVARHHSWLRRELPPLIETTKTVCRVHGDAHPELQEIGEIVDRVNEALLPHLDDEEQRVFPSVRKLSAGTSSDDAAALLDEMRSDHDSLGADLHRIRELTNGFAVPADACAKYREMLSGLLALESDMHTHVHLENNVLLPRALKLLKADNR